MADDPSKKRLGRGLAALIGEIDQPANGPETPAGVRADRRVPIEHVARNPHNPRRAFEKSELEELAASIRKHGIVQPVLVRPVDNGRFEIIAGERRWRAAQMAGLIDIPVLVRDVDDRTALEIAIVENVQRSDLNPVDEALGYEQLIAQYSYTQNDLGEVIGKSRSHVANSLRLLKLPHEVREMVSIGSLSAGHARALVSTPDPFRLARKIVAEGLSVREAEKLAQDAVGNSTPDSPKPQAAAAPAKDADTLALERNLTDLLGLKVQVNHKGQGGQLKVDYKSLDQLETLCRLLGADL
ncbi:ParB/RepB/Spo0J family partition protein [Pseudohoeflea coraliihabitans]|uniref:ParB/RepB/Spo0J family partition protein n=1 Tax=Pseudohoeflea coraliihabitans TaxID=2860393 RepID=A0ABS6WT66_9HYPH|nr:ParB/RepB/Spo0J family partition protein [Pseudohoeflea sp. DP4N28-3]MBW3099145.1 ParB/RepB/Spo0J family partition protein [Pseudohoeflea sp. DP4N28-3]